MSWNGETNPHFFWTRDQPHEPPPPPPSRPPGDQPGPSRQPSDRKIRTKRRPDHDQLPPPIEPTVSRPTHHGPEIVQPTSQDHWPLHPHEPAQDHYPIHPHHLEPTIAHPHPTRYESDLVGPTIVPPQPTRQPHQQHQQQQPPDHVGPTTGFPEPKRKPPVVDPTTDLPQPKRKPPKVGSTAVAPPRRHTPPAAQRPPREQNLIYPSPHKTNALTWCIAIFCVILWVAIILGGILILIIYLAYRPRSPHFEISDASLNAAYLDMGYLLNADLTLLVNFSNVNEKMSVDFNFIVLKLRYENHMIANQYIEPFSAGRLEKKFARVEMVSSQIRLPVLVTQQLIRQIQGNRITFEIDGYFHARSRLGTIFRYSYWLYSHCTIVTKGPPSGVMVVSKCITKR